MAEIIDIVDSSLNVTGKMDRDTAHRTCAPHRTFHCWLYNSMDQEIMFQIRGKKQDFPMMLDVTVGGHISSGETVKEASREIWEEIGIRIPFSNLRFMGRNRFKCMRDDKCIVEIADVHCYDIHDKIGLLRPNPDELYGLVTIPFETAAALLGGSIKQAECAIQPARPGSMESMIVTTDSFIAESRNYFLAAANVLRSVSAGETNIPKL